MFGEVRPEAWLVTAEIEPHLPVLDLFSDSRRKAGREFDTFAEAMEAVRSGRAALAMMPTASEMRAPYISAERMSRPWSSVPSRNGRPSIECAPGGRRASMMSIWLRS